MGWRGIMLAAVVLVPASWTGMGAGTAAATVTAPPGEDTPVVRIDPGGRGQASRSMVLSLNKAAIVELPADARDVVISNPEIVEAVTRTARRSYLIGMKVGQANAFFLDAAGEQIANLEIRVERDLTALRDALARWLPDDAIRADALNDTVVLSGSVGNAARASQAAGIAARYADGPDSVLNMLAIEAREQVLLKVTVAEMQRSLVRQLGIDWSASATIGDVALRLGQISPFSLAGAVPGGFNTGVPGDATRIDGSRGGAAALVQAFERTGLVRTLAEPNLTAISGESANFLAGGEYPVPASRDRDGNVVLEFKPFGVGLGFTPVVLGEGRISLRISTEVSELTGDGAFVIAGGQVTDDDGVTLVVPGLTIPALKVRRAETTVELPSGGALVMAGLLSEDSRQNVNATPGVKDVPVLGELFRSREFLNDETELVVVVTPWLVDPVSPEQLTLPTDGAGWLLMDRLNAAYAPASPEGALQGPVGFVVE